MKFIKHIAIICSLVFVSIQAAHASLSPAYAQTIYDTINNNYGTVDQVGQLNLGSTNNPGATSSGMSADYGQSQRYVINAICAFGASMDNSSWRNIKEVMLTGVGVQQSTTASVGGAAPANNQMGLLSAWIIIPTLINVFASMDLYIQHFFGPMVFFALFLVLLIFMGVSILQQMHEGKLDLFSWISRSVVAAIVMLKANMICNYVLAISLSLAAMINGTLIHGVLSDSGMQQWYVNVYGPDIMQKCQALIGSGVNNEVGAAFNQSFDHQNLQAFLLNENGAALTASLCQMLGGPEAYNSARASSAPTVSAQQLEAMWALFAVYNVGLANLQAHATMGNLNATNLAVQKINLQVALAQGAYQNKSINASSPEIQQLDSILNMNSGDSYKYLTDLATRDQQAQTPSTAYHQPRAPASLTALGNLIPNTAHGTISGWLSGIWKGIKAVADFLPSLSSMLLTLLVNGTLQVILMAGLFFWIILGMALCKMGCVMMIIMSPTIVVPSMSKHFWTAMKVMVYPSIYPAALIIIMQMDAALASWFGSIGLNMPGTLIFAVLPLLFGIAAVFMLPSIVKKMMQGGNAFMAQMGGVKTVAMIAAAAVTLGASLAAVGGSAAAGAAAKGGAAKGGAGGKGGVGPGPGDTPGLTGGGDGDSSGPSTPSQRAMANSGSPSSSGGGVLNRVAQGGRAAMSAVGGGLSKVGAGAKAALNAPVPMTKTGTVGGMMAAAALGGGIPGMAVYSAFARYRGGKQGSAPAASAPASSSQTPSAPQGGGPGYNPQAGGLTLAPSSPAAPETRDRLPSPRSSL